ncbi:MAG TPA: Mrp/NBP35 family ATP-binding protein [Magnetospirillaceae bacterium]|nr:Mrp/NBP35 family ATP-binding protein [Magnetospirillaceae bacterium]
MAEVNEGAVLRTLEKVIDPQNGKDIVTLGMVSGIVVKGGHVAFALEIEPKRAGELEAVRKQAEKLVHEMPGVLTVSAVLTAERGPTPQPQQQPPQMPRIGQHGSGSTELLLTNVKSVIAVASGKGGVGKSTTAVNLALALKNLGLSVGLFDADIFGPSQPRLLGMVGTKPTSADGKKMNPIEAHGLKVMSLGFMMPEDNPVVWRGLMVMGALEQFMKDVAWGDLDVMVIDMPPGTGDTQLTIAQRVKLAGAVIVSTPQDIALIDARKGINMFNKVNVPVLGLIENMSVFSCPNCGHESHIFGHGGARADAERLGVDFLGELPLDIDLRIASDEGKPVVVTDPEGAMAQRYRAIAEKIKAKL